MILFCYLKKLLLESDLFYYCMQSLDILTKIHSETEYNTNLVLSNMVKQATLFIIFMSFFVIPFFFFFFFVLFVRLLQ